MAHGSQFLAIYQSVFAGDTNKLETQLGNGTGARLRPSQGKLLCDTAFASRKAGVCSVLVHSKVPGSEELIHRFVLYELWDGAYTLFKATAYSPQTLKDTLFTAALRAYSERNDSAVGFLERLIDAGLDCRLLFQRRIFCLLEEQGFRVRMHSVYRVMKAIMVQREQVLLYWYMVKKQDFGRCLSEHTHQFIASFIAPTPVIETIDIGSRKSRKDGESIIQYIEACKRVKK